MHGERTVSRIFRSDFHTATGSQGEPTVTFVREGEVVHEPGGGDGETPPVSVPVRGSPLAAIMVS